MLKSIMLIVGLSTWFLTVNAQDDKLDSIKTLVETYKAEDSVRVNLLINLTEYYTTRDFSKNLDLIHEALEISNKTNYRKGIGKSLNALTSHYVTLGELDKALTEALKAKEVLELLNAEKDLITTHNLLARIYLANEKFEKALEIHLKNIELIENDPPSPSKAKYYFYVAKTYQKLTEYAEAEKHYKEALKISEEVGFLTGVAIAEGSLGGLYNLKGNYREAVNYLNRTLSFSTKNNQITNIAATNFSLAESYIGLKNYTKAIEHNSKSIKIYEDLKNYRLLSDLYQRQFFLYEQVGDFRKANGFLKLYYSAIDTLFSENKVKLIEELQTKYETGKKDAEIELLSQQSEIQELQLSQQRYFLGGLSVVVILLIAGGIMVARQRKLKQEQVHTKIELTEAQKRLEIEKQYRDSELKALRSQMNPHFVFNALNSIQEYIVLNEKKLAGKYLGKFADLMRTYLNHSQVKSVTIQEEVDALNLYLELEKLRFEESLNYKITLDKSVDPYLLSIPTLLIQPYVENALKHGLLHIKERRKLLIEFNYELEFDLIVCEITDNGIGRKASAELNKMRNPKHKSFATEATKNRLELLNYNNDRPIGEQIEDIYDETGKALGTKVILKIPVAELLT